MEKNMETTIKLKQMELEIKTLRKRLDNWENLSVEDGFYTFNCIKETGTKNWKEFCKWMKENPDKTVGRKGVKCIIISIK